MEEVSQKITKIKSVFLDTELFCATNNSMRSLLEYLEEIPVAFRSIGYESASMAIALKDFEHDNDTGEWQVFANGPGRAHEAQVYIGLGWAIAKLKLPFLSIIEKLHTLLRYRVADGCGYYDGSFRQRQTLINQQPPVYLPTTAMPAYDQGVGRCLWYICNADIDKIKNKIETFSGNRHAPLWRGIGIAVAYVGGCDDKVLAAIFDHAGQYRVQLAFGAALAAKSRMEANTMTTDTDRCSRLWFKLAAAEADMFSTMPGVAAAKYDSEDIYISWIKKTEEGLAGSFKV